MKSSIARLNHPLCPQHRHRGREGGPIGFQHTAEGLVAIGEDGFPMIDDEHELESSTDSVELERYSIIDIRPE